MSCYHVILKYCHVIFLTSCHSDLLSSRRVVILTYYHLDILSSFTSLHVAVLSCCHLDICNVILSCCHLVMFHVAIWPSCHVHLGICRVVILTCCDIVILFCCHLVLWPSGDAIIMPSSSWHLSSRHVIFSWCHLVMFHVTIWPYCHLHLGICLVIILTCCHLVIVFCCHLVM